MKTNNLIPSLSHFIGILLTFLCLMIPANAQKVKTHKIWVTLLDETKVKGTLYAADEVMLVIVGQDLNRITLDPRDIELIKIRKAGSIGRGTWIGAVTGLVAGSIVNFATDDSGWAWQYNVYSGALIGVPLGAAVGIGIGSKRKKIVVNGDKSTYILHLPRLRMYTPQTIQN